MRKAPMSALLAGSCLWGSGAFAQARPLATSVPTPSVQPASSEPTASVPGADAPVQGIVVTAQNRSQRLEDVPIAISVVSGEAVHEEGLTDFTSLQRVSPALQITSDTDLTRVTVRDVGTLSAAEGNDIPRTPRYVINLGYEHEVKLAHARGRQRRSDALVDRSASKEKPMTGTWRKECGNA